MCSLAFFSRLPSAGCSRQLPVQEKPAPNLKRLAKRLGCSNAYCRPRTCNVPRGSRRDTSHTRRIAEPNFGSSWRPAGIEVRLSLTPVCARFGVTESIVNTSFPELRRTWGIGDRDQPRVMAPGGGVQLRGVLISELPRRGPENTGSAISRCHYGVVLLSAPPVRL